MVSRIHHCIGQIKVAEGTNEPPARKCRCREFITFVEAASRVKRGEASWVVTKRERRTASQTCSICGGDKTIKTCAGCNGVGTVIKDVPIGPGTDTYNNDIVVVSEKPADETEKKRSSVLSRKTPRVATIEAKHIVRAYLDGNKESEARIEEYGSLIQFVLQDLGAELRKRKNPKTGKIGEVVFEGHPEPENNPKTGTGRDYDYGRTI